MTVAPTSIHPGHEWHPLRWTLVVLAAFLLGAVAVALLYHYDVLGGASGSAGLQGSGVSAAQTRHVARFDRVELAGTNNVVIHVGGSQSVVVRADDNLLRRVTTAVRARTLVVGNRPGSFTTRSPMSVEVAVPTLGALTLSGSGNIVVDGVAARALTVRLPGSGTLTGRGTAARLDLSVAGSGSVQFTGLVAEDVRA
ncbi:MAG TPA: DUF2807 domain-containing protein, partial [Gaiellaceae bacterium]|nr:DUF2807 domain-containing protein [Gaiellaceae bacterium]